MHAAAAGYSNLEYDLERGARGSRMSHVEELLAFLTGAEAALVVNNNAAASCCALNTLAEGSEVIVSRGELVEIGGSFRIPDDHAAERRGCARSAPPTGPTSAISRRRSRRHRAAAQGARVELSRIEGFTAEVPLEELVEMREGARVPVMVDVGSGALLDVEPAGGARTADRVASAWSGGRARVPSAATSCWAGRRPG